MTIQFSCPWCWSKLQVPQADAGTKLRCPKCSSLVVVPRESDTSDPRSAREGYGVRDEPEEAEKRGKAESGKGDSHLLPERPEGGFAQKATVPFSAAGRAIEPPPQVVVPGPPRQRPRPAAEPSPVRAKTKAGVPLLPSERPKLPRRPMLSGTVTFLFQRGSLFCWIGLSAATFVVLAVIELSMELGSLPSMLDIAGPAMAMSAATAGCSAIFLLMWLVTVSVYMLTVLQESAAGNDRVMHWPDPNFIDWVADALYVINSIVVCVPIGLLIAWGFGQMGIDGRAAVPIALYLLFPIVLLSMLEAQSRATPITAAVLWTLVRAGGSWVLFYMETAVLALGTLGVIAGMAVLFGVPAMFPSAVVVVGALLLYFRLLGRLAWCCAEATRLEREEGAGGAPDDCD